MVLQSCNVWKGKNSAADVQIYTSSPLFYKIFSDKHSILSCFENNIFVIQSISKHYNILHTASVKMRTHTYTHCAHCALHNKRPLYSFFVMYKRALRGVAGARVWEYAPTHSCFPRNIFSLLNKPPPHTFEKTIVFREKIPTNNDR